MLLTVAIALVANEHLKEGNRDFQLVRCTIKEHKILEVAKLFFKLSALTRETVNPYIEEYKKGTRVENKTECLGTECVVRQLEPLPFFRDQISGTEINSSDHTKGLVESWSDLLYVTYDIVVLIFALSHVRDLNTCANLPIGLMPLNPLRLQLRNWDGKSDLAVSSDTWFSAIAGLINGHRDALVSDKASLISDYGWSVFVSTFSNADPTFIDPTYVSVTRGVQRRHEIRKTGIVDGPISFNDSSSTTWTVVENPGNVATLRCIEQVERSRTLCGEQMDNFILSICLKTYAPPLEDLNSVTQKSAFKTRVRAGYRAYHKALWSAQRSRRCEHSLQEHQEIRLPLDTVTMHAVSRNFDVEENARIVIILTARNRFARWRALIDCIRRQILLRGNDCCFACVVDQAVSQPGRWYIIL